MNRVDCRIARFIIFDILYKLQSDVISFIKMLNGSEVLVLRKRIMIIIAAFLMVLISCAGFKTKSYAYTEEQKQQAKAWLSAHGYSPDAGGAAAAYQDYLNGKFDEELGITREETTGSSQSAYDEPDEDDEKNNEKSTEESTESPVRINSVWDVMGAEGTDQMTSEEDGSTSEETTEVEITEEPTTQYAYEEPEEDMSDLEDDDDSDDNSESTLYIMEKADEYKEAITVVILAVLGIAIGFGAVTLMKK